MLRLICSTISIAAVLGMLAVGCGSDTSGTPSLGGGGTTAQVTGGKTGTGAGGSSIPPLSQGGSTAPATGAGGKPPVTGQGGTSVAPDPCGNGTIDPGEDCEGSPAADDTCANHIEGTVGELSCVKCKIDTALCQPAEAGTTDGSYGDV
jgi:hypothetical protein